MSNGVSVTVDKRPRGDVEATGESAGPNSLSTCAQRLAFSSAWIVTYKSKGLGEDRQWKNLLDPSWKIGQKLSIVASLNLATRPTQDSQGRVPLQLVDARPSHPVVQARRRRQLHLHDCPAVVLQLRAPGLDVLSIRVLPRSESHRLLVVRDPYRGGWRVLQPWLRRAALPEFHAAIVQLRLRPPLQLMGDQSVAWQRCVMHR